MVCQEIKGLTNKVWETEFSAFLSSINTKVSDSDEGKNLWMLIVKGGWRVQVFTTNSVSDKSSIQKRCRSQKVIFNNFFLFLDYFSFFRKEYEIQWSRSGPVSAFYLINTKCKPKRVDSCSINALVVFYSLIREVLPSSFSLRHESGRRIERNARFIPDKIKEINSETSSLIFLCHSSQLKEGI